MAEVTAGMKPELLWQEFEAISRIPRCSRCEGDVLAYIEQQAQEKNLEIRRDAVGNLVVVIPATPGMEDKEGIVLQGHVDMVCEQNAGTGHNFDTDPIKLKIEGDWLTADGTTLGADNGIAVAIMLSMMKGDFPHGPLELLFTIDEETGLTGALGLDASIINYRKLINLDSEEEGYFYIGCAGGVETIGTLPLKWEAAPASMVQAQLSITGLNGGHSGASIHMQLANSLVLATRVLYSLAEKGIRIFSIEGGDKHNAIPREAFVGFLCKEADIKAIAAVVAEYEKAFRSEYGATESGLKVEVSVVSDDDAYPAKVIDANSQERLINLLYTIPHGVISMSRAIPGLVSTSTNFASIRIVDGNIRVLTSQRSDIKSQSDDIARRVATAFLQAGGTAEFTREYPGWQPDPESKLLKKAVAAYKHRTGKDPIITSIHAGLECGVIGAKCGGMEMISFGPDIRGAHTPEEKVHITSTERVFDFFLEFIAS